MANMQALQRQGWYLSAEGIQECTVNGKSQPEDIIKAALDHDLKDIGERHLPDGVSKNKASVVDGPFVLQIQKVRNVAAPKENEESHVAPRIFRLNLTDGHSTCTALEMEKVPGLGSNTPPGTKVKLSGKVPVNHGFLLLNHSNCKVLGGHVEKLVENWELKRTLAKHTRSTLNSDGAGPPPFIPFGQKRKDDVGQTTHSRRDNFRSLESSKEKSKEDSEFEQQRQATIAEALQTKEETPGKKFGSGGVKDKDIAKIVEMGFTVEQATVALKGNSGNVQDAINSLLGPQESGGRGPGDNRGPVDRHSDRRFGGSFMDRMENRYSDRGADRGSDSRIADKGPSGDRETERSNSSDRLAERGGSAGRGGGRGGRSGFSGDRARGRRGANEDDDEYDMPSKPSAPATLFDFLTDKIPNASKDGKEAKEDKSSDSGTHDRRGTVSEDLQQQKRGPPNLPPRLIKQQQKREEERARQTSRSLGPRPMPGQMAPRPDMIPRSQGQRLYSGNQEYPPRNGVDMSGPNQRQRQYSGGPPRNEYPQRGGEYPPPPRERGGYQRDRSDYHSQRGEYQRNRNTDYRPGDYPPRGDSNDYHRQQRSDNRRMHDPNRRGPVANRTLWSAQGQEGEGGRRPTGGPPDSMNVNRPNQNNYDQGGRYSGHSYNPGQDNSRRSKERDRNDQDYVRSQRGRDYSQSDKNGVDGEQLGNGSSGQQYQQQYPQQTSQPQQFVQPQYDAHTQVVASVAQSLAQVQLPSHQQQTQAGTGATTYPATSQQQLMNGEAVAQQQMAPQAQQLAQQQTGQATFVAVAPQIVQVPAPSMSVNVPAFSVASTVSSTAGQLAGVEQHHVYKVPQPYMGTAGGGVIPTMEFTNSNRKVAVPSMPQGAVMPGQAKPARQWKPGDYCMAKYWEDKQFYRATIQSLDSNGQSFQVNFTDYGNTETVHATDIRPVPKDVWSMSAPVVPQPQTMTGSQAQAQQSNTAPVAATAVPASVSTISSMPGVLMPAAAPSVAFVQAYPTVDHSYQGTMPTAVAYSVPANSAVVGQQQPQQKGRPAQTVYGPPLQRGHPM